MSNIVKELTNPTIYRTLPWETINFLTEYKKKLDIQELICLIENMYLENKDLAFFKIKNKKNSSLCIVHPEVKILYEKGWVPNNYLLTLTYFDEEGQHINNNIKPLYEKILQGYGFKYINRIIKEYFSNIKRENRFIVYHKILNEFRLTGFEKVINRWEHNPESPIEDLAWFQDKEYGITLPVCYYSYGHINQLKKSYESFIPYWELEMEIENLDHQQFIWKMEFYFNQFKSIKNIILRDPYHSIRHNKLLSFEKDFSYKINIIDNFESVDYQEKVAFNVCDLDLYSALDTTIYKMFTEEAIVLGKNKKMRIKSYQKMFDNLSYFNSRKVDDSFFNELDKFDFSSLV